MKVYSNDFQVIKMILHHSNSLVLLFIRENFLMKNVRNNINFMEIFGVVLDLTPSSEDNLRAMPLLKHICTYVGIHLRMDLN